MYISENIRPALPATKGKLNVISGEKTKKESGNRGHCESKRKKGELKGKLMLKDEINAKGAKLKAKLIDAHGVKKLVLATRKKGV